MQLALIGSRLRAFQRAVENRVRYRKVPKRVAQNAILLFLPVKFDFCRKKSATKLLCVKTPSGNFVAPTVQNIEKQTPVETRPASW